MELEDAAGDLDPVGGAAQARQRHRVAKWYVLGRWSYGDSDFHRTSVGGQGDADGFVSIDTFFTKDHPAVAYRLRLTLFRRAGSSATPSGQPLQRDRLRPPQPEEPASRARRRGGSRSASTSPFRSTRRRSTTATTRSSTTAARPGAARHPPRWSSSTGARRPLNAAETAWVKPPVDPWVDYTARFVYDYHYQGAGNWPFNAAYASERGLVADVTQLHNLARPRRSSTGRRSARRLGGAWKSNKLTGAIKSTNGHLLVIGGFDRNGNVIAYDPAHDTDAEVRQVYDREEFERAWIPASGGIVYVIRPSGHALPSLTANNS